MWPRGGRRPAGSKCGPTGGRRRSAASEDGSAAGSLGRPRRSGWRWGRWRLGGRPGWLSRRSGWLRGWRSAGTGWRGGLCLRRSTGRRTRGRPSRGGAAGCGTGSALGRGRWSRRSARRGTWSGTGGCPGGAGGTGGRRWAGRVEDRLRVGECRIHANVQSMDVPQEVHPPYVVCPAGEHPAKLVHVLADEGVNRKLERRTGLHGDEVLPDRGSLVQLVVLGPQAPPIELCAEFQNTFGLAGLDGQCVGEYGHRRPPRVPPVNPLSVPPATSDHVSKRVASWTTCRTPRWEDRGVRVGSWRGATAQRAHRARRRSVLRGAGFSADSERRTRAIRRSRSASRHSSCCRRWTSLKS